MTRDEHVRRVRANSADLLQPHLVDEGPMPLAGHESWWTVDAIVVGGRSLVLDRWMLVRDGVGWTASVADAGAEHAQHPRRRDHVVSTLRFE